MADNIRYVHTNLIARDWKRLSQFYIDAFGCKPVGPERDLSGEWLERLTMIKGAKIRGVHLLLPGNGDGPTLEILQYYPEKTRESGQQINAPGFGHIAFHVDDVERVTEKVIVHGGAMFGEVVRKEYAELGLLTAAYVRDPEGNVLELQNWKK